MIHREGGNRARALSERRRPFSAFEKTRRFEHFLGGQRTGWR